MSTTRIHKSNKMSESNKLLLKNAWGFIRNNNPNAALFLLDKIRQPHNDWYIAKAHCFSQLKLYGEAISSLTLATKLSTSNLILLSSCYQHINQFSSAIRTIQRCDNWYREMETLSRMSQIYENMGNYFNALLTYRCIHNYFEYRPVLLGMASCCEKMGHNDLALIYIKQVKDWAIDPSALLIMIQCYLNKKEYKIAFSIINSSPNLVDDQKLLILSRYNEKIGQYQQAINTIHFIQYWQNMQEARLVLARCYEKLGQHAKAAHLYQTTLALFPYYLDAYYDYCRFLVECNKSNAKFVLDHYIHVLPFMEKLYLLKYRYECNHNNLGDALATLIKTTKLFPQSCNAYFALIKEYHSLGDTKTANHWSKECLIRFSHCEEFIYLIKGKIQSILTGPSNTSIPVDVQHSKQTNASQTNNDYQAMLKVGLFPRKIRHELPHPLSLHPRYADLYAEKKQATYSVDKVSFDALDLAYTMKI